MRIGLISALCWLCLVAPLAAQDSIPPRSDKSYSAMYQRFDLDAGGRATLMTLRWNRWNPGAAGFEGGVGLIGAGGPGGFTGDAGGVFMLGDRGISLLLRGGVSTILVANEDTGGAAFLGAYGGISLLLGPGNTRLRVELSRYEYTRRAENIGGWMLGLGLGFIPRGETPKDTGH